MKVLVTGATGCLGRNLVEKLLNVYNWEVHATGRNSQIGRELISKGVIFHCAELSDKYSIIELCRDKEIVFHCGALSSPWGKYESFYNANILGTQNIIDGCIAHKVKRLVYVSSPSIYFDYTEKHNITEDETLSDKYINHYIETKKKAEQLLDQAFQRNNLPVVTIRPRAIFGPFDNTIMPRVIEVARKGKLPFINKGNALIDVTYVENVVDSLILSATADDRVLGKKYNITNGEPVRVNELLQQILLSIGVKYQAKNVSYQGAMFLANVMEKLSALPCISKEPKLTKYSVAVLGLGQTLNIGAAKEDLGYRPNISIKRGIQKYSKWWKESNYVS